MLNEKREVQDILIGNRINKKYTYRSCYLLAKHFKSQGLDILDTRKSIFEWSKKVGVYISDDLNSIIRRAFNDKHDLMGETQIKISKQDLEEIKNRFDTYNTRLTAFALLCYAKKYADKSGQFYISRIGLSNWIGITHTHLSTRHIAELCDFGYLSKVKNNNLTKIVHKQKFISKNLFLKIHVNFTNTGEFTIDGYDIRNDFDDIWCYK